MLLKQLLSMEPISSLNNITVYGYSFTQMITKLILTQY